jgi:hypothetical protein
MTNKTASPQNEINTSGVGRFQSNKDEATNISYPFRPVS